MKTIEEMRKEIAEFDCAFEGYECDTCPHYPKGFCDYNEHDAPNNIVVKWHKELFPEQYTDVTNDPVNHPSHYETGKFECIEVMQEVFGVEAVKNFCLCNAFKYLYRTNRKNGLEDVKKCQWYVNKYLEIVRNEESKTLKGETENGTDKEN